MCTKTIFAILDSSQNEVRSRDSKLPSAEVIRESMWPTPPRDICCSGCNGQHRRSCLQPRGDHMEPRPLRNAVIDAAAITRTIGHVPF